VITYNIHKGAGIEKNPSGLRKFLTNTPGLKDFDVLAVQEICGDNNALQVRTLSALLSTPSRPIYTYFVSSDLSAQKECGKGQAIFSRRPIVGTGSILLPFIRQPRVMVWVDVRVGTRLVRIYNLHLDNRSKRTLFIEKERLEQVRGALNTILEFRRLNPSAGTIVTGDFNSFGHVFNIWHREPSIKEMRKYFEASLRGYKMTALPFSQLDWIFYDGLELVSSRVIAHFEHSDHFPVVADFKL